jgi:hypothetical protein
MLSLPSTSEIAEISVRLRVRSGSLAIKGVSETEGSALCRSLRRISINHHSMRSSAAKQVDMHYPAASAARPCAASLQHARDDR